jgi:hypothetical protein
MPNPAECLAVSLAVAFVVVCFVLVIPTSGGKTELQKHVAYCLAHPNASDCT